MATFEKELKVGKTDAYQINVSGWLDSESFLSLVVTDDTGFTSVGPSLIDGSSLSVLLTGVSAGNAEIHFNYTTATRSDCRKATVKVVEGC